MNPVELKMLVTALTNFLYCRLSVKDFIQLTLFISLLSKEMLSMEEIRRVCKLAERRDSVT